MHFNHDTPLSENEEGEVGEAEEISAAIASSPEVTIAPSPVVAQSNGADEEVDKW